MKEEKSNNFLLTFLLGAATGAVLGLMYAPERGSETRRKLSDSSKRFMDDFEDFTSRTRETISELTEKISDVVNSLAEGNLGAATMEGLDARGNWNEIKGNLKQRFSNLTDDDLKYVEGKENELIGRLQQKLNKTKNQVIDLLKGFQPTESRH
jgi:uncharacterized protein YjbJ (UPF0337 family)